MISWNKVDGLSLLHERDERLGTSNNKVMESMERLVFIVDIPLSKYKIN
jgi:hypothetical protein